MEWGYMYGHGRSSFIWRLGVNLSLRLGAGGSPVPRLIGFLIFFEFAVERSVLFVNNAHGERPFKNTHLGLADHLDHSVLPKICVSEPHNNSTC